MSDVNEILLQALRLAYPTVKASSQESGELSDHYVYQQVRNALALVDHEEVLPVKVGMPEIRRYMAVCADPMTQCIYRRLEESRRKNALWCHKVAKLEEEVRQLRSWLAPQEE